jgi:DNA-binding response OmpR family regulator
MDASDVADNAALMALTECMGTGSLDDGVRVVGINPGATETQRQVVRWKARAQAAFNTVEFLTANGMQLPTVTPADKKEAREQFFESPTANKEINSAAAIILKGMLDEYDVEVVRNAAQVRNYVKMRLMMLTGSDKESTQLKALELLGKMSDVGAFEVRIDINVTHRTTEELQAELASKLSSYMDGIIDVEAKAIEVKEERYLNGAPAIQVIDLDEELGLTGKELDVTDD